MDLTALADRISGGRLFHSYIVTGGDGPARERAGQLIARAAVCSGGGKVPCGTCRDCQKAQRGVHPDIVTVERADKARELTVDVMRSVRAQAGVVPNEAARSVTIIREADSMNLQAQNAMLKVFEEPPAHAVFVLLAENPERFLPTVRSRCETVSLSPAEETGEGSPEAAEAILRAYREGNDRALMEAVLPLEKAGRTELPEITGALRRLAVRDTANGRLTGEKLERLTETLDRAEKLMSVNVSAGHIAGLLLAALIQTEK